ncbi:molybdate transport system substrate-binding protein [Cyclobacterium lianum]|uniref:Molybdate transport system substrate-binding protein n=2 Tax=Cyclobacterium lianum TaxID=388280 RepID=A0A1M7HVL5_9BACT|nr:molybdate transport system substrate-binding protein [Cyclobacterium lianum]
MFFGAMMVFQLAAAQREKPVLVAAASDLKFALDSIIIVFSETNPVIIRPIYGSSGKLYEQISNQAPFHIFMSADVAYPKLLEEKALTSSAIYLYGLGRLVIWSRKIDTAPLGMTAFQQAGVKKIAIANPDHAPYGERAVEALTYYRMYDSLSSRLVLGENISQAAQFVSTGAADAGIIALSLALSPTMKRYQTSYFLIPEESHQPLLQGAVMTSHGGNSKGAASFMAFLKTETAIKILNYYGFNQPEG